MSAREPQTGDTVLWHREPEQTGLQPKPLLRGWLQETGLLTARLRRLCASEFRLEVLDTQSGQDEPTEHDFQRRVILHCGEQPCVYAETVIPAATAATHPWLNELGDEPLGERLQTLPEVHRSEFRYALLTADSLPSELAERHQMPLWARQSDFHISDATLTVTEVFLPGVVDNENRRMKLAD
ncbi:MAG: chorismate lyase [Gammaproteobacteria bacterium]|jgi:chorismate--pyruvate lyase|nr:chorismate lyase [Gammaproteobacteria bacterium]MDP6616828.1 chorismate lyase [Gammaproteobacteria bacterium]MDP6694612.1 chorismate lyase [Gammaproteobacteria bacterium]MDP7042155.1 chorismate lyase [Gammaproteobacteria bacterium]